MMLLENWTEAISFFLATFSLCLLVMITFPFHKRLTRDNIRKVQSTHHHDVPRVGGVPIVLGALVTLYFSERYVEWVTTYLLMLTLTPSFLIGLLDDCGLEIRPRAKLLATVVSGIMAIIFFDTWIYSIDFGLFDYFLGFTIIGVSLTVFASVTLTHAYNLSDGLNGLSSGYGIIALISLRFLAMDNGDVEFVSLISPFIFAILGFWIINILSGRIFLGDSGAYTIGHVVAWLAILFSSRNPEISPWALLLITIFPIFDLVFSVVRRLMGRGAIDLPDRCHMHHLVFDALVLFKMPTLLRSSLGSLILLLPASVIATFSCLLSNQTNALVLLAAFVVVTAAFIQKGLTSRR